MTAPTVRQLADLMARPHQEVNMFADHVGVVHVGTILSVARSASSARTFNVRVRGPGGGEYLTSVRAADPTDDELDRATLARWRAEGRDEF